MQSSKGHAPLIHLRLTAAGLGGLDEMLGELEGLRLGDRFVLRSLYAVGGQSILYVTDDLWQPDQPVLTRLALLRYHRPAYITDAGIRRVRQRIEREARLLQEFDSTPLPRFCGLFYAHNPLHAPERGPEITDAEPYLVIELIRGVTVLESVKVYQSAIPFQRKNALGSLALGTAHSVVHLCRALYSHGYLYTDLNPRNLVLALAASAWPVRVVDAGSIIPSSLTPDTDIPFSWAYIPPEYYEAYNAGRKLWPTERFVMYTLGKTLWQVLTNRQPMPAEHPDVEDATLLIYPEPLVDLVRSLIEGRYESFDHLHTVVEHVRHTLRADLRNL